MRHTDETPDRAEPDIARLCMATGSDSSGRKAAAGPPEERPVGLPIRQQEFATSASCRELTSYREFSETATLLVGWATQARPALPTRSGRGLKLSRIQRTLPGFSCRVVRWELFKY